MEKTPRLARDICEDGDALGEDKVEKRNPKPPQLLRSSRAAMVGRALDVDNVEQLRQILFNSSKRSHWPTIRESAIS